ncbi:hypothetical protein N7532_008526 [Penicillium argentinense]|uniref:Uncharacterized protein n=1 Tax=Penicillium argentinense TaxID=1131581 RepID=A0A9W9EXK7_9EURO|nr:uncharacterized protein N7532_008526 [Penicillium argentinense]KAJ5089842.1 hypothetical protein N7532_008526 [Penicillium argentinense]
MPLHIIENDDPETAAWGELPLEVYFLSEWEKPHPDPSQSNESPADRRKRLLRQFLALGSEGREPYWPGDSPAVPTEAQIDEILRPIRPEALRTYACNTVAEKGLWLRLCYTNEEAHNSLWADNEEAEWVSYDGVVLDDESIFGGLDLAAALEIFPERVTNESVDIELRDNELREIVATQRESPDPSVENYSDELKEELARGKTEREENPLLRYGECVVTHIYVEDEVATNGGGLLNVFLDDCGNVVRQWRVHNDGSEDNYDGTWFERVWKDDFLSPVGEIGPAYHEGGSRGPPYTIGSPGAVGEYV